PGLVVIFLGVPPATGTIKMSLFVLVACISSRLLLYATSLLSGEKAYWSCPPRLNGGTSCAPGVRSRATPPSAETMNRWLYLPSKYAFQCRNIRWVYTVALTFDLARSSSRCLLQASSW